MHNVLFLMRVSFICNVCLLLILLNKWFPLLPPGAVYSTVIVMGIILSFILNIGVNIVLLILFIKNKKMIQGFPRWLIISNCLFLIPQFILLSR